MFQTDGPFLIHRKTLNVNTLKRRCPVLCHLSYNFDINISSLVFFYDINVSQSQQDDIIASVMNCTCYARTHEYHMRLCDHVCVQVTGGG